MHIYYKNTHSKQYHKAAKRRAGLRTETTVNNTYDFGIGWRLCNLPALRQIGFEANRRILEVEKLSHDCAIGQQSFLQLQQPADIEGRRASALRFGDPRVQALFAVLVIFSLQPQGFRNKDLRPLLAQALGLDNQQITQGKMSYDLRRLRLHRLIHEYRAHTATNSLNWGEGQRCSTRAPSITYCAPASPKLPNPTCPRTVPTSMRHSNISKPS